MLQFHLGDLACQLALFFQLDAPGGRLGPGTVLRGEGLATGGEEPRVLGPADFGPPKGSLTEPVSPALPGGPGHNCHLYFDVALQSTGTQ